MITWWSLVEAHFLCQKVSLWLFVSAKNILEIWKRNLKFGANCFRFHISHEVSPTFFLKKYACFTDFLGFFVGSREGKSRLLGWRFYLWTLLHWCQRSKAWCVGLWSCCCRLGCSQLENLEKPFLLFFCCFVFFLHFFQHLLKGVLLFGFRRSKFSKIILEIWELVCTGNSSKNTYICNIYMYIHLKRWSEDHLPVALWICETVRFGKEMYGVVKRAEIQKATNHFPLPLVLDMFTEVSLV